MAEQPENGQVARQTMTPTEYLVMEVLAARHRLGEAVWTFPTSLRPVLKKLDGRGLVSWRRGIVERTILASFTDAGRAFWLYDGYLPPSRLREVEHG